MASLALTVQQHFVNQPRSSVGAVSLDVGMASNTEASQEVRALLQFDTLLVMPAVSESLRNEIAASATVMAQPQRFGAEIVNEFLAALGVENQLTNKLSVNQQSVVTAQVKDRLAEAETRLRDMAAAHMVEMWSNSLGTNIPDSPVMVAENTSTGYADAVRQMLNNNNNNNNSTTLAPTLAA